jgi:hypothetical protein
MPPAMAGSVWTGLLVSLFTICGTADIHLTAGCVPSRCPLFTDCVASRHPLVRGCVGSRCPLVTGCVDSRRHVITSIVDCKCQLVAGCLGHRSFLDSEEKRDLVELQIPIWANSLVTILTKMSRATVTSDVKMRDDLAWTRSIACFLQWSDCRVSAEWSKYDQRALEWAVLLKER